MNVFFSLQAKRGPSYAAWPLHVSGHFSIAHTIGAENSKADGRRSTPMIRESSKETLAYLRKEN